jgi:hydroxymethylglutaryl-CoA lyase
MLPTHVTLVEVGPRDGLQNEAAPVAAAHKIDLVHRLQSAGCKEIEVTSYVSPKWVPQMADNAQVMAGIRRAPGVRHSVLTPNLKGLEAALADPAARPDEVVVFGAATQAFSQKNINCSIEESIERFRPVVAAALMLEIGVDHCGIADTIGVGTPRQVQAVMERALKHYPLVEVSGHFHDTYGQSLANIYACLEMGVHSFDASVAGLGGCPYAKGATGNVATEDVVFMLNGLGIHTGIDIDALVDAGAYISQVLGRPPASRVGRALLARRGVALA